MNTETKKHVSLAIMMFMQFMLVAVWWVSLAAWLENMGASGDIKALVLSSMAIGSMASPLIGAFADRYLPAQRVLAIANLLTAALLAAAGFAAGSWWSFAFILLAMLCYMPTWSLTSSIALVHARRELFPRIRMFGTIGWVASGLFSLAAVYGFGVEKFDGTTLPVFCGSAVALLAAALNLNLPNTPPAGAGKRLSLFQILGLDAFWMLNKPDYRLFMLCSILAMISFSMYYSFGSEFLQSCNYEYITLTMNWGQTVELFFLFFATTIIARLGIRWAMAAGLAALTARYLSFWIGGVASIPALYITGILFHGLIFGLFFVGGQIYTDRRAPAALRAQAQGMYSFIIWGLALLAGNFFCRQLIDSYTSVDAAGVKIYDWNTIFGMVTGVAAFTTLFFIFSFKEINENKASTN
ncbi:MAG: MFS transporter [Prevotellaceae bacterium]|jgi:nucleoside transporter|nr:MFS transporter [Prevotellaceae bacterium]